MRLVVAALLALTAAAADLPKPSDYSPVAAPAAVTIWGSARFTVINNGLVRMEALKQPLPGPVAPATEFDDRPTLVVVNRVTAGPAPSFSVSHLNATAIQITTPLLTVVHDTSGYTGARGKSDPSATGNCSAATWFNNTDQDKGTRIKEFPNGTNASGPAECCDKCSSALDCETWVYATDVPHGVNCYLMYDVQSSISRLDRIAGGLFGASAIFNRETLSISTVSGAEWRPGDVNQAALPGSLGPDFSCSDGESIEECTQAMAERVKPSFLSTAGWGIHDDTHTTRRLSGASAASAAGVTWFNLTRTLSADYYFFAWDPTLPTAMSEPLQSYATISGRASMVPRSALGLWWSHYYPFSQEEYDDQVLGGYKDHGLPLNHAILDLAWHIRNTPSPCAGYGGFLWNQTLFTDPASFLEGLRSGSNPYGHALEFLGNLHVQEGVDACQGAGYHELARRMGLPTDKNQTIKCELGNETFAQGLFELLLDPAPPAGSGAWPYRWTDYGGCGSNPPERLLWNNILFGGHVEATTPARAMVLTRNGGRGNHRTPVYFTGDTEQCYGTIQYQVKYTSSNAADLMGYTSHDIGGFKEDATGGVGCVGSWQANNNTQGALYLRWLQWGALSPIMRTHCTMCVGRNTFAPCNYCERRIWEWPDLYPAMKDAMLLRNALGPYLYTAARSFYDDALATVRPMYFDFPTEAGAFSVADSQYMFGPHMLAAPVSEEMASRAEQERVVRAAAESGSFSLLASATATGVSKSVWLPPAPASAPSSPGWVSFDGSRLVPANTTDTAVYGLSEAPVFVLAGAVIPMKTMADVDNNASVADPAVWSIWAPQAVSTAAVTSTLYEDAGNDRNYEQVPTADACAGTGICRVTQASSTIADKSITIDISPAASGSGSGLKKTDRKNHFHIRGAATRGQPVKVDLNGAVPQIPASPRPDPATRGWYLQPSSVGDTTPLSLPTGTLVIQAGASVSVDEQQHLVVQF